MVQDDDRRRLVDAKRLCLLTSYMLRAIGGDRMPAAEYETWIGEVADLTARYAEGSYAISP